MEPISSHQLEMYPFQIKGRQWSRMKNMQKIKANKAVGEAFGYYFDENGEVVHQVQTIGLQ